MVFFSSPTATSFHAVLEIRGINNRWSTYNFVLEEQLLIPHQIGGKETPHGSLNIAGCNCVKIPPAKAQWKLFPFKIAMAGTKYVLNASSETQREQCILLIRLAASDPFWVNPFYGLEVDQEQRLVPQQQQFQALVHVRRTHSVEEATWSVFRMVLRGQCLSLFDMGTTTSSVRTTAGPQLAAAITGEATLQSQLLLSSSMVSKLSPSDADGRTFPFALAAKELRGMAGSVAGSASLLFSAAEETVREQCIFMLKMAAADGNWINPFYHALQMRQDREGRQKSRGGGGAYTVPSSLAVTVSDVRHSHHYRHSENNKSDHYSYHNCHAPINGDSHAGGSAGPTAAAHGRSRSVPNAYGDTAASRRLQGSDDTYGLPGGPLSKAQQPQQWQQLNGGSRSSSTAASALTCIFPSVDDYGPHFPPPGGHSGGSYVGGHFSALLEIRRSKATDTWATFSFVLVHPPVHPPPQGSAPQPQGLRSVLLAYREGDEQRLALKGSMDISLARASRLPPASAGGRPFAFKVVASPPPIPTAAAAGAAASAFGQGRGLGEGKESSLLRGGAVGPAGVGCGGTEKASLPQAQQPQEEVRYVFSAFSQDVMEECLRRFHTSSSSNSGSSNAHVHSSAVIATQITAVSEAQIQSLPQSYSTNPKVHTM